MSGRDELSRLLIAIRGNRSQADAAATSGLSQAKVTRAERGRFPAINVLKSISRTMPGCHLPHEREIVKSARQALSSYANMEELIRIGAYRTGADPLVDRAIALNPDLESFLAQDKDEVTSLQAGFERLDGILASVPQ